MRLASALCLLLVTLAGGCTQFPELDRATDPAVYRAPYPALLPFDQLTVPKPDPAADPTAELTSAAAALHKEAAALSTQP